MKELTASQITAAVRELCIEANYQLPQDVTDCIRCCHQQEDWPVAKEILGNILDNISVAAEGNYPLCQDTGLACVFVRLGQEVHISGDFAAAVDEGVRQGYRDGYLRASAVADPLRRVNTGDNTPALLTVDLVPGDACEITVAPKGFGSENMGALRMLRPAMGLQALKISFWKRLKMLDRTPARRLWSVSASAAALTRLLCVPNARCCARLTSITRTPSGPKWNRNCWKRSMR